MQARDIGVAAWFASGSIGLSELVPLWRACGEDAALLIDCRIGYRRQLARSGWSANGAEASHSFAGPQVNLSGPFLRLSLGLAASPLSW